MTIVVKLGLAVSALLVLGGLYRASTAPPATAPVPTYVRTPAAVLPQQVGQEWTFQVDARTLSQNLNSWAATQGTLQTPLGVARLQHLNVDIRDNELFFRGTAVAGSLTVSVEAAATASVQDGNLQVQLKQARINGVDVPPPARNELEQQLQNQIARSIDVYHVVVHSVRLGNGTLAISGTGPRPPA